MDVQVVAGLLWRAAVQATSDQAHPSSWRRLPQCACGSINGSLQSSSKWESAEVNGVELHVLRGINALPEVTFLVVLAEPGDLHPWAAMVICVIRWRLGHMRQVSHIKCRFASAWSAFRLSPSGMTQRLKAHRLNPFDGVKNKPFSIFLHA
ncbi:hypothetical protein ACTPOK_24990 [Streptomyces inhibens]|uniref:hypothetical protein n=1 Tax=Streptomyces inhibens TaxID=2293571 RepID=UPI00402ACC6D